MEGNKVSQLKKIKYETWIEIEKEFNIYFGATRHTAKQLRRRYCFYVFFFRYPTASMDLSVEISSIQTFSLM